MLTCNHGLTLGISWMRGLSALNHWAVSKHTCKTF